MTYTPTIRGKQKNYISWDIPNTETSFNYALIDRSLEQSANYSGLVSQVISNNTYFDMTGASHWYRLRFQDATNNVYSDYTAPFQTDGEYYCTPREVASFMGRSQFDDTTNPTRFEVEDLIAEVCDEIERITHDAWRKVRVNNEYYDVRIQDRYQGYGAYPYDYSTRISLHAKHRNIRTFTSGITKIEVWNGTIWKDFITSYIEGRANDYWINYERGIVYFVNNYPLRQRSQVRLTYDFGQTEVPGDIKRACILMTAASILGKEDLNIVYPSSTMGNVLDPNSRWEKWNEMAQEILKRRTVIWSTRNY